jgi:hypothetical protein
MDKRRRVKEESREAGSRRAHRAAKQIFVDIEQGFRTALRGFREFEYAIREDVRLGTEVEGGTSRPGTVESRGRRASAGSAPICDAAAI